MLHLYVRINQKCYHQMGLTLGQAIRGTILLGEVMELTDEAKYTILVFGYVWLEMISLCVMSFQYL